MCSSQYFPRKRFRNPAAKIIRSILAAGFRNRPHASDKIGTLRAELYQPASTD